MNHWIDLTHVREGLMVREGMGRERGLKREGREREWGREIGLKDGYRGRGMVKERNSDGERVCGCVLDR